ncbi:MAG: succinate dehydrogenase, cytochrome b556 subunit [Chloroflexi bacterium]|nr:succinate dehydrogenase, cytochrome b556 subunit [Chloroflexota bacterium]
MYRVRHTDLWPSHYNLGMWVWLAQRISGIVLVLYLFTHIWVISFSIANRQGQEFNQVMALFQTPLFLSLDLLLLAGVLFHALNGIRVILFDLGIGIRQQKAIFWGVLVIVSAIFAWGVSLWWPFVQGKPLV